MHREYIARNERLRLVDLTSMFCCCPGLNSNARILGTTRLSRTIWWDMHTSRTLPSRSLARPMTRTTRDSHHSTLGIYLGQETIFSFSVFRFTNHCDLLLLR